MCLRVLIRQGERDVVIQSLATASQEINIIFYMCLDIKNSVIDICGNLVPIFHICEHLVPIYHMCEDLVAILYICEN